MRNTVKIAIIAATVLTLATATFIIGFGTAYLLTGSGVMPAFPAPESAPSGAPSGPSGNEPTDEPLEGPTDVPTVTPLPLPTPTTEDEETFQLFWEVWDLVQRTFYGDMPDMRALTYAAIQGMLETLDDDYTAFIEPEVAQILAEDASGEFEGIGAWVGMDDDGKLEIVGTFEGGAAEQAEVLAGDRVIEVDGVSVVGMSLYEIIGMIRGPAGTQVTLLIERQGEPELLEFVITRRRFDIPITEVEMRDDGIGYIQLRDFSAGMTRDRVEEGIEELLAQDATGIIFDLRGNPGGRLDQALEVADLFLDDGVIAIQRWSDGSQQEYEAKDGDVGEEILLVVLVDRGSASASEIVAGALQDRERAILIGETTFGKGSVQSVFTLSDGSELRVTSARWFTPNEQPIQDNGLKPDIEVLLPEELEPDEDPQLERAVQYLLTGE